MLRKYSKSRLCWYKVVTRFTGSGDIDEKLVSHIKTVPWINITAAKYITKWNIFMLNKSLRKLAWLFEKHKKIKIVLLFSTCVLVVVWRTETSYYAVTTFLDDNAVRLVVTALEAGQQLLIIILIIFIRITIIMITSALVKRKINRAGVKSFQFPCRPRLAQSVVYDLSPWQWA